jgi:phosphoribosylformylglycinamidine cyclo-ligase
LGNTIGDELLKVHVSYGPLVQALLKKFNGPSGRGRGIKGLAHITGGGFVDNIPRVLPKNCDVMIHKGLWDVLPIFRMIQKHGGVPEAELYQVFNMGIGMTIIVSADQIDAVMKFIRAHKQKAWLIGEVVKGKGVARVV